MPKNTQQKIAQQRLIFRLQELSIECDLRKGLSFEQAVENLSPSFQEQPATPRDLSSPPAAPVKDKTQTFFAYRNARDLSQSLENEAPARSYQEQPATPRNPEPPRPPRKRKGEDMPRRLPYQVRDLRPTFSSMNNFDRWSEALFPELQENQGSLPTFGR